MSSPKASLHSLYIQSEQQPKYDTQPVLAPKESVDSQLVLSAAFVTQPQQIGYICTLSLPDLPPVVSDVFPKKREAEQDAARKALDQLGRTFNIQDIAPKPVTREEKVRALAERIGVLFSDKVIRSCLPLKEHFRAAMRRVDETSGAIPVTALAALDSKMNSLCKSLNASSENDPVFAIALVWEAAKNCPSVTRVKNFLIKRVKPFASDFKEEFLRTEDNEATVEFCAVYIPSSEDKTVSSLNIRLELHEYYMDVLSKNLGLKDGESLMMSRPISRAPQGTRIYSVVPDMDTSILMDFDLSGTSQSEILSEMMSRVSFSMPRNKRATEILGFPVYGDAVLANIGSSWKLEGKLSCIDVSLSCYYRLVLGRSPEGNYKLSRDAILVAKLPSSFSSRSQWRGKLPLSLLIDFCQQHRCPDPDFSISSPSGMTSNENQGTVGNVTYKFTTKIVYQGQTFQAESERPYRNQNDAKHSAALQALHFLSDKYTVNCDKQLNSDYGSYEKTNGVNSSSHGNCKRLDRDSFSKGIVAGSIVFISYDVWLIGWQADIKVESHEEFEFELGTGSVLVELENTVAGMQVGGFEQMFLPATCLQSILAANEHALNAFSECSTGHLSLRYDIKLLKTLEPPEERMESALFSPPLSKQRNEFAIQKIMEIGAKSLVDLGCGSGSLLEAVIEHGTDLETIVGVDISKKSLVRAAKSLSTKLGLQEAICKRSSCHNLKRLVLYEGSLAEADQRLCGYDIATCIEVVEHMDPEPLSKAGEIILGTYCPRLLILSTPNIEYNGILQKITTESKTNSDKAQRISDADETALTEDGISKSALDNFSQSTNVSDDDSIPQSIKLRNDDHRFEWTRAEFGDWAGSLASRFGYTVEYSGVGGSVEDPGFASQIAIFKRISDFSVANSNLIGMYSEGEYKHVNVEDPDSSTYSVVWKYER